MIRLKIEGMENLPASGSLIIIANHFSWYEAPLINIYLPYDTIWIGARELEEHWFANLIMRIYRAIPVWRGQVDRQALKKAIKMLKADGVLGIMPEGNIDPALQERVMKGEMAAHDGATSRGSAKLIRGRPGVAYLAATSNAKILPIAFLGTELVSTNIKRLRRTSVTMRIGEPFGPLVLPSGVRGKARKEALQVLVDGMMGEIAQLMPAENRGRYKVDELSHS